MGGVFAGSAARVAGGIGIVACAAVVALAAGGGKVLGGLGGIFGTSGSSLQVAKADTRAADILVAPAVAGRRRGPAASRVSPVRSRGGQRVVVAQPRRPSTAPVRTLPSSPSPSPSPVAPAPAPTPVPSPPPPPVGGGGATTTLDQTVKQVSGQLPPQTQPVTKPVTDVVDTLAQTCRGLPVCP